MTLEINMYKWLENVELSNFKGQIEDFVNHLVDPASLVIPDDPVFVSYREAERLRLMSAGSLKEMSKQMEESRQFIEKAPQDTSCVAMVVNSSDMDQPHEKALKDILRCLVEKGMNRAEIRMTCNVLHLGLIQVLNTAKKDEQLSINIIKDLKEMVHEDKAHLVDDYLTILNSHDRSSEFKALPQYLEELIIQQMVELETQRKKLRDDNGLDLSPGEVICPLTRKVIQVEQSLATSADATKFIMLIVVLAQLAKVRNNDLDEFINNQDSDYINKCFELLQQYVQKPEQLIFTGGQHELLDQLGMGKVLQQWQEQGVHAHSVVGTGEAGNSNQDTTHKTQENTGRSSLEQSFRFFSLLKEEEVRTETSTIYNP